MQAQYPHRVVVPGRVGWVSGPSSQVWAKLEGSRWGSREVEVGGCVMRLEVSL